MNILLKFELIEIQFLIKYYLLKTIKFHIQYFSIKILELSGSIIIEYRIGNLRYKVQYIQ